MEIIKVPKEVYELLVKENIELKGKLKKIENMLQDALRDRLRLENVA